MSEANAYLLLSLGVIIVIILSYLAYRSVQAVKIKENDQKKMVEQVLADQQQRRDYAQESIRLLTLGAIDQQVGAIEASIRINGLMDFMGYNEEQRRPYQIFNDVALATNHIPVRDDWNELSRKEKSKHERTMSALEKKHQEAISCALKQLKDEGFLADKSTAKQAPMFYAA
ncbi:uncharacterized protein DUF2489 [Sinobacterium caligoides]|uniref:Uncharacterized protein DUF2489 n=1 Tax=Sinobacterium caligoides TaxID=933926 RepID=A0A3N2DZK5_9GAMM|nr:DUF2489 domain-containing protein [Sinobacterium caligoides]ROS05301.1 uncharacterized protein DUF2489 [Sinobacterium caligoides]